MRGPFVCPTQMERKSAIDEKPQKETKGGVRGPFAGRMSFSRDIRGMEHGTARECPHFPAAFASSAFLRSIWVWNYVLPATNVA